MQIYRKIALDFDLFLNAKESSQATRATHEIDSLVNAHMPHGSGFDNGTTFDYDKSSKNRLVFNFGYHHMNSNGFYTGWSHHSIIVTPSLANEYDIRITGPNKNQIKDYIAETFMYCLEINI